jgi:hypothetical protein
MKLDAEPSEALRASERPLVTELEKPTVLDKARMIEICPTKLDADPSEALKYMARPLKKEDERPIALDRDLNIDTCPT